MPGAPPLALASPGVSAHRENLRHQDQTHVLGAEISRFLEVIGLYVQYKRNLDICKRISHLITTNKDS